MKKIIYTDVPQERKQGIGEQIGMIFAMLMLFVVLPIAICIIASGF